MPTLDRNTTRRALLALGAAGGTLSILPGTVRAANSKAQVTFSGLRVYEDGSSTLRVDLTKAAPVQLDQKGTCLVYLIKGAQIELRNNKNPLRAEFFSSNVISSKLDDTKEGARLEVQLRSSITPVSQMIRHAGGVILRIDIPAATK